jgi:thiamine biosynthesis protein ThiI
VPDEDCCSLFTPRFPATRASHEVVERAERDLDVETLVATALSETRVEEFRFPMLRSAARSAHAEAGEP